MYQDQSTPDRANDPDDGPRCDAELHVRLCARRLTTGHLQIAWRVEHVDNIDGEGESLDGTFGPFTLPHEAGQQIGSVVRNWWKTAHRISRTHQAEHPYHWEGTQLTLGEFLRD